MTISYVIPLRGLTAAVILYARMRSCSLTLYVILSLKRGEESSYFPEAFTAFFFSFGEAASGLFARTTYNVS